MESKVTVLSTAFIGTISSGHTGTASIGTAYHQAANRRLPDAKKSEQGKTVGRRKPDQPHVHE